MRFGEKAVDSANVDYWFLRDNDVGGNLALRIVGMAYKGEEKE